MPRPRWMRGSGRDGGSAEPSVTPLDPESLRLQVLPLDLIAYGATDTLREVGGGMVARLVRRTHEGVEPVSRSERLSLDGADWYDVAAEQTFRRELVAVDVREHVAAGVSLRMVAIDGNPVVTTAMLWPGTLAGFPAVVDVLVCAPRFSAVLVRPVLTQSDIGAATTLWSVVRMMLGDVDDPCSDGVFWWRAGGLHRIEFDDDTHQPVLPPELGPAAAALPR